MDPTTCKQRTCVVSKSGCYVDDRASAFSSLESYFVSLSALRTPDTRFDRRPKIKNIAGRSSYRYILLSHGRPYVDEHSNTNPRVKRSLNLQPSAAHLFPRHRNHQSEWCCKLVYPEILVVF
jgi:hypothetical protein